MRFDWSWRRGQAGPREARGLLAGLFLEIAIVESNWITLYACNKTLITTIM
jgi:hypothetical protein